VFGFGPPGAQSTPAAPVPARPAPPAIGPTVNDGPRGGALVAWDPVTQKERWRSPGGGGIGGGTVTTAGNLVFQVIPDGRLVAYSADKGEKLLDVQTGMRGGMGPPITYQLDGKQYVSFMGGTGRVVSPFPAGNRAPAPAPAAGAAPAPGTAGAAEANPFGGGPNPVLPKLLTFVLDGKEPLPVAAPAPPAQ
jgi:quinohemoprotein ethanol dehydrogenase